MAASTIGFRNYIDDNSCLANSITNRPQSALTNENDKTVNSKDSDAFDENNVKNEKDYSENRGQNQIQMFEQTDPLSRTN